MLFAGLVAVMQFGWSSARDTSLERLIIDDMTVKPAAWLINHLTPEVKVLAEGNRLKAAGGGINVRKGCEGAEVIIMLTAAMMVAQLQIKWRLLGILTGSIAILICNQIRILAMFYVNRSDKALFDLLHGIVAPVVLILIATGFFIFWLDYFGVRQDWERL